MRITIDIPEELADILAVKWGNLSQRTNVIAVSDTSSICFLKVRRIKNRPLPNPSPIRRGASNPQFFVVNLCHFSYSPPM